MKKSNKIVYDVELNIFHSYELNQGGSWLDIYILEIGKRVASTPSSSNVLLKYINLEDNVFGEYFVPCDHNDHYKVQSRHVLPIETDPKLHKHELAQLFKIMNL